MTIDWNTIAKDVETQVLALAEQILTEYAKEASADTRAFLDGSKDSLVKWGTMLVNGEIDREEFESLVRGQLDVAELHALKQAGLAQVRIDTFVNGVVKILTSVVMSAAKGLV